MNLVYIVLLTSAEVKPCREKRDEVYLKYARLHHDWVSYYVFKISLQKRLQIVSKISLNHTRDNKASLYSLYLFSNFTFGVLLVD